MNEELIQEQNVSDEKRAKAIEYFSNMSENEKEMLRAYMREHFNEFQISPIETLINGFKKIDSILKEKRLNALRKLQEVDGFGINVNHNGPVNKTR